MNAGLKIIEKPVLVMCGRWEMFVLVLYHARGLPKSTRPDFGIPQGENSEDQI